MSRAGFRRVFLGLILASSIVSIASAQEASKVAAISSKTYVVDSYVWRGQVLSNEAALQPGLTVSYGSFSINVWNNMNLNRGNGRSIEFNEIDFTAGYEFGAGRASMSAGVIEYSFPNVDVAATTELYFSTDIGGLPVEPSFAVYYDIDEADGFYVNASVAKSFALSPKFGVSAALAASWASGDYNAFYFGVDEGALNDTTVSLSTSYAISPNLGLELGLSHMWLEDSEIAARADAIYGRSDRVSVLIGVSHAF